MEAAGGLHDIVEDTPITLMDLKVEFHCYGADCDLLLKLVDNVTTESGKNRKERNLKTYPKIKSHPKSLVLKLADRLANVRNCIRTGSDLLSMYKKEYPGFREALYSEPHPMWAELDKLLS
jgi:(p)ppGpp synthase/HD superfamily hydrolase